MRAMERKQTAPVSIDDAARRVGAAIYGDEWVGELTERERWLIARYVEGSVRPTSTSIVYNRPKYEMGGRAMAEWPSDPEMRKEVEKAYDRNDWRAGQWDRAFEWLETKGFDLEASTIDSAALSLAISRFVAGEPGSVTKRARGRRPLQRARVMELMKEHMNRGYDLRGAKEEELSTKYGASRDTCRTARKTVLAENVEK
jgi:hypothetical protein